jgi:putative spermidine/putrescine transport system ATP-binding protein
MLEINALAHVITRKGKDPLHVLEQVGFSIPGGHLLALIGPTASGKTTLLQVLAGLTEASGGSIMLKGRDLVSKPLHPNELGWVTPHDDCLLVMPTPMVPRGHTAVRLARFEATP